MNEGVVFGLGEALAVGIAAVAAVISAFTYIRNKKSEQIKIAREEWDNISTKFERLIELDVNSTVSDAATSPLVYLYHVEEIMKECRYFGYLIRKKVIKDEDILGYYKPEVTEVIKDIIGEGRKAFQQMNNKSHLYPHLLKNIEDHIKLVDIILSLWG